MSIASFVCCSLGLNHASLQRSHLLRSKMHRSPLVLLMSSFAIVSASTYTNPLKKNGADPAMVRTVGNATEPGYYYLLNTASHGHIEMVRSTTLDGLKDGDVQSVWSNTTPSRCRSLWAPEVHELDGIWYMYYTASAKNSAHRTPLVLKGTSIPMHTLGVSA